MNANDHGLGDTITINGEAWTVREVNEPDEPDRTWFGLVNEENQERGTAYRLSALNAMVEKGTAFWH